MVSKATNSCALFAISLLMVAALGMTSCGEGIAASAAVQVGDRSIAHATVTHWMSVIAGETSLPPGQPLPSTPDPPRYSACIAYYQRFPPRSTGGSPPGPIELKHECEFEFQKEKLKALYFLISFAWVSGEAKQLGVSVTDEAVKQEIAKLQSGSSGATVKRFLVGLRGSTSDLRLRIKLALYVTLIQHKLEVESLERHLSLQQRQHLLTEFGKQFVRRWTAKTSCRSGYVVPICRQYETPKVAPTLVPPSVPLSDMRASDQPTLGGALSTG